MSEQTATLRMPARPDLVAETIECFDTAGLRSSLLAMDNAQLQALGLKLTDRELTVAEVTRWLNEELGGTPEEPAIHNSKVDRFASHFRRLYGQVRLQHARRLARLSVDAATAGDVSRMQQVATARLTDMITERLLDADGLEDMTGTELKATIATLGALTDADFKKQELALKTAEAERRAEKLAAEVQKLQLDLDQRRMVLQQAKEKFAAEIQSKQSKKAGGQLSNEDIADMRRAIFGDAA